MRAHICARQVRRLSVGLVAFAAALTVVSLSSPPTVADPRLERAQERQQERQEQLDGVLADIDALESQVDASRQALAGAQEEERRLRRAADDAQRRVANHVRTAYVHGRPDPTLAYLSADDPRAAMRQSRVLAALATRERSEVERLHAAHTQTDAAAAEAARLVGVLAAQRAELETAREQAATLVAEAEDAVEQVRVTIRREREEELRRQRARERAARASRTTGPGGDIACPVGRPRSFSDTYGAPRSGGRSHRGTDILAPMGIPIYAYENGTISRMGNNRLGGITLYLRGDSGNTYYYAHLQGYVGGLSTGQRVRAGQHIAFNGDTGNARGIPHLHIEVMPGGSGNVNPYPYMRRACG